MATWSAPVRYAEVDQQGVVFNAHYLLYCDVALGAFCDRRGLGDFAAEVRVVTSTLTWSAAARFGDEIEVDVRCTRVGTSSATLAFDLSVDAQPCCRVETVYVLTDGAGSPRSIDDHTRAALLADVEGQHT